MPARNGKEQQTKAARSTETRKAFENRLHTQPNYKQQATEST
jgi:hypothetical protein